MGNQESHVVRGLPLNCTLKKHSLMGLLHLPPPDINSNVKPVVPISCDAVTCLRSLVSGVLAT